MTNHQEECAVFFEDEHDEARGHSPSTDNLFSNRDVLARRLKCRLEREDLVVRGILPGNHASPNIVAQIHQLERAKTGDLLQKKIKIRSSRQQLVQRHILADSKIDASLQGKQSSLERHRIADSLNEQLFNRPGPLELVRENILKVEPNFADAVKHGCVPFHPSCRDVSTSPVSSVILDSPSSEVDASRCSLDSLSPLASDSLDTFAQAFSEHVKVDNVTINNNNNNNVSDAVNELESCIISTSEFFSKDSTRSERTRECLTRKQSKGSKKKQQAQNRQKIKKYKYHEYKPPGTVPPTYQAPLDDRYKRLLEQQQMFLQMQVMKQNAMFEAINGTVKDPLKETVEIEENSNVQAEIHLPLSSTAASVPHSPCAGLDDLRVSELRSKLKQRGLPVSGSKAKLLERLKSYEDRRLNITDNEPQAANPPSCATSVARDIPMDDAPQEQGQVNTNRNSFIKVTTYAAQNGETFQVVQAVPNMPSSEIQYQLIPSSVVLGHGQSIGENVPVQALEVQSAHHTNHMLHVSPPVPSIDQQLLQNVVNSTANHIERDLSPAVGQSMGHSVNQSLTRSSHQFQIQFSQPPTYSLAGNSLLDLSSAFDRNQTSVIDALTLQMLSEQVHQAAKSQASIETQTSYESTEMEQAGEVDHSSLLSKLQNIQTASQQSDGCGQSQLLQNQDKRGTSQVRQDIPHHYQWDVINGFQGRSNKDLSGKVRDRSQTDPLRLHRSNDTTMNFDNSSPRTVHQSSNGSFFHVNDSESFQRMSGKDLRTLSLQNGILDTNVKNEASDDLMDILGELSESAVAPLNSQHNQPTAFSRYQSSLQSGMHVKEESPLAHLPCSKSKSLPSHTFPRPYGSLPGDLNLLAAGMGSSEGSSTHGSFCSIPTKPSNNALNVAMNSQGLSLTPMHVSDDIDMENDTSYFTAANDMDWPNLHHLDSSNFLNKKQTDKSLLKDMDTAHCVDTLNLDLMSSNLYEETKAHDPLSIFDFDGSRQLVMSVDAQDPDKWDF